MDDDSFFDVFITLLIVLEVVWLAWILGLI